MNTCGTATLERDKKRWRIECEPHVALRLKRVFGKLDQRGAGAHFISDTIENARDLQWFAERYPLTFDPADHLEKLAAEHRERQSIVEAMLARRAEVPAFDLAVPAREYQRIAAAIVLAGGGLLIADDVGLGKTISAICTFTDPRTLPALVVTLTHLPRQWEAQIAKFAPQLRTHILRSGQPYEIAKPVCKGRHLWRVERLAPGGARCSRCSMSRDDAYHGRTMTLPDVIVTNYHKLAAWAETLAPLVRSVVYDECQELRSGGARETPKKYTGAMYISRAVGFRTGLSATPFYNYGGEFHSVMECIRPDALGSREEFNREWCTHADSDKPRIKDPTAFGTYVRESGLMLRRTRADVGRELPPITKVEHHIDADVAALEQVSASCAELARVILAQGEEHRGQKMHASEELSNKLRQATGIAKAPYVAEFVRLLVESGERVLLYGWHRAVYDIWEDKLRELRPALYSGSESTSQKDAARDRFISGDTPVLMMSLRSGAGLDGLQHVCRTIVFGELDWSPGVHEQCEGRVARDGQKEPVMAYYLVSDSGADPVVAEVLGLKKHQIEGLRDPDAELVAKLEIDPGHVKKLAEAWLAQRGGAAKRGAA